MTDTVTHRCADCDAPVEVALADVSTMRDHAQGVRKFLWGRALGDGCGQCGSRKYPNLVIDDTDILTQPYERPNGRVV